MLLMTGTDSGADRRAQTDSPEVEVFEGKLGLNDPGGLDSGSQHVLLGGYVAWLDQPLQVVQVAEGKETLSTAARV